MSRSKICCFAVVAVVLAALPAAAQEGGTPQFILVHSETVKPPMMDTYVQTTKTFIDMVGKHRDVMKTFNATAFQTDEMEMVYAMPMSSFADMDRVGAEFMAMEKAGGDAWHQLMQQNGSAVEKTDEWVVMRVADASYEPAEPAVTMEDAKVYRWDYYYLQPGMEAEALQIARDVKALYQQKGLHDAWDVYQAVTGGDLPFLVVSSPGQSVADVEARNAAAQAAIGDAWAPIEQRIQKAVRRTSSKYAYLRPDLSIPPPQTAGETMK